MASEQDELERLRKELAKKCALPLVCRPLQRLLYAVAAFHGRLVPN